MAKVLVPIPNHLLGTHHVFGEGHGNPLQYSCLENPMDREALWLQSIWLQSWIPLKRLRTQATSLVAQLIKNSPAMGRPRFDSWLGRIPWKREWLPTPVFWPGEFSPWSQTKSRTQLSDFHFTSHHVLGGFCIVHFLTERKKNE